MAVIDGVAGRTGKQIEAAKKAQSKRLGQSGAAGKQKRCKKGKSCGASCINSGKVCLVDIPWASGSQLTKVAKQIQARPKPSASVGDLEKEAADHLAKVKKSLISGDAKGYDEHRKNYLEADKKVREKGGKSKGVNLPEWSKVEPTLRELKKARDKGDKEGIEKARAKLRETFLGEKPAPKLNLSPITNDKEFTAKLIETRGEYNRKVEAMHQWAGKLFGTKILYDHAYDNLVPKYGRGEEKFFDKLRNALVLDFGKLELIEAFKDIQAFTSGKYGDFRRAQMGTNKSASDLMRVKRIEELLSRREFDKPRVEKFRGKRVNDSTLQAMIESARVNGSFGGKALSSWSTELETAQYFASKNSQIGNNRVIYRTVNSRGVPIGSISSFSTEQEVLTPSTANYRYVSYRPITLGPVTYHMFDVEET